MTIYLNSVPATSENHQRIVIEQVEMLKECNINGDLIKRIMDDDDFAFYQYVSLHKSNEESESISINPKEVFNTAKLFDDEFED